MSPYSGQRTLKFLNVKLLIQPIPGVFSFSDTSDHASRAILSLGNRIDHKSWLKNII